MARVVFLGTPEAARPTLQGLSETHEVALVVTQPDRPQGRSKRPVPPPIKLTAGELELPVSQPGNKIELHRALSELAPFDLGVVVAFGQILRPEVLALPAAGFLNVHFSLLPRWRGAAPVARALMAGDGMTGVTIMKLDEGLDTGPVLTAQAVDILANENAGHLTDRLAGLGARLLVDNVEPYLAGKVHPVEQSDEGLTYAEKVTAVDRPLSPSLTVDEFIDQIRGLAPDPGATLDIDGGRFKILDAVSADERAAEGSWIAHDGWPVVGVADGAVRLARIQPPGKSEMSADAWLRGSRRTSGSAA